MNTSNHSLAPLILIIDDNKDNLHFLCDIFIDYRKAVTTSGLEGIALASSLKPDLILLDVVMPEIDGFEVCRQIKIQDPDNDIPIIFLTGKTNVEDIIVGLKNGAVDYITKPFSQEELLLRVKSNLELKASKDIIRYQNLKMEELNDELKQFMSIAAHDLKNSLLVIQGFTRLLKEHFDKLSYEDKIDILTDVSFSSESMFKIITNISLITSLEEKKIIPYYSSIEISYIIEDIIDFYIKYALYKDIKIKFINKIKSDTIVQDYSLLKECLGNLITNAIKFSPVGSEISIIAYSESINQDMIPKIVFEVIDEGPGIKEQEQDKIFKKFAKLSSIPTNRELTTGLGLAITKLIAEVLKSDIEFESQFGKGSKFSIKFPINHVVS